MSLDIPLSSLFQRSLVCVEEDVSVGDALAIARAEHIHHLPVTRGTRLVGMLCSCDLAGASPFALVSALMKQPVVALDEGALLTDAVSAMNAYDIGSVVLLASGLPSGIVTRGDLMHARPELAALLEKSRCSCCGLTRHLENDASGQTFCMYCREPGSDARENHLLLDE